MAEYQKLKGKRQKSFYIQKKNQKSNIIKNIV